MRMLLSRLSARDWLIVIGGLALVVGIEMAKPAAPPEMATAVPVSDRQARPPVLYPEPVRRLVHDVAGLTAEQRTAMDEALTDAPYFTVFAAGSRGGYGWARGFSTQKSAVAAAMAACSDAVDACRVVAEVVPQAMVEASDDSMSFDQAQAFRRIAGALGPRAFARSLDGAWATAVAETGDAAAKDALTRCDGVRTIHDYLPPMPCEVIAIWHEGLLPPG